MHNDLQNLTLWLKKKKKLLCFGSSWEPVYLIVSQFVFNENVWFKIRRLTGSMLV